MIPIPPLIEIEDLTHIPYTKIDVSKIPVTRYKGKNKCDLQFNMLPEKKYFLHTSGSYFLKGKGPNKEGYRMLPPFDNNPEEYGTKCFPWIEMKTQKGDYRAMKLSKKKTDYIECRFILTVEELRERGLHHLINDNKLPNPNAIRQKKRLTPQISINIHTLLGFALFPQYFQNLPEWNFLMDHKGKNYDYRLSQLSLLRFGNNYLKKNLKNTEEKWIREIMGRQSFSTGGLVGG
jgi:hypothetical protein